MVLERPDSILTMLFLQHTEKTPLKHIDWQPYVMLKF